MSYYSNIGQVSFRGDCVTHLPVKNELKTSASNDIFKFKERYVTLEENKKFEIGKDYYFDFSIKAFEDFDTTVEIQLVNSKGSEDLNYQFLKSVVIPKRNRGDSSTSHIILFPMGDEDRVKIVHSNSLKIIDGTTQIGFKDASEIGQVDEVYELVSSNQNFGRFYLYKGNYVYHKIEEFNSIPLQKTWQTSSTDENNSDLLNYIRVKGIFSPLADGFDAIRLKIMRTTNDYFSSQVYGETSEESEVIYGRVLSIKNTNIYQLKNLIGPDSSYITETNTLHKIGIWGNHGLMFALNGEEIQVGPTGYYELDVLPITRLGIAAFSSSDSTGNSENISFTDDFTIDYQYRKETAN